jgi:hypothetical protein
MNDKYSKFSIAPLSDKKYIVNENLGIFVVLQETNVEITNHVYHYSILMDARVWERKNYLFNN